MKRKPRVLVDSFHLLQALTGIRTYTSQLCQGIEESEQDDCEYMITPSWRKLNEVNFLRGRVNVIKKILNHIIYFIWKQIYLPLYILFRRIDLIIAPDYLLPFIRFGAKGIAVVHDTFYWELKGAYNPIWRKYFLTSAHLGINNNASLVVTTQYILDKANIHLNRDIQKHVVYQAPKDLTYVERGTSFLETQGLSSNTKYFLHVGIFEKRKNLSILVKAFAEVIKDKEFEDFYLVLAGSRAVGVFHDDFKELNALIEELNIVEKVILPGFVLNEQLGELYKGAFAYVFPSTEEGFGIPVLEAMNSGTPVIVSDQPALLEVGADAVLSFPSQDYNALVLQMKSLKKQEIRETLIERGYERVHEFSRASFFWQFHKVVLDELGKHKLKA